MDSKAASRLATQIDEIGDTVLWSSDLGHIFAEVLTANGRTMSDDEKVLVVVLKHWVSNFRNGWEIQSDRTVGDLMDDVSDEEWKDVEQVVELSDSSVARARMGDLLWELKKGDAPHVSAQIALDAHIYRVSDQQLHLHERFKSYSRAMHLSRTLNAALANGKLLTLGNQLASEMLASGEVAITIAIMEHDVQLCGEELATSDLLESVKNSTGDPWLLERVGKLEISIGIDQKIAFSDAIAAFERLSDEKESSIQQWSYIQQALVLATQVGHPDRAQLATKMQTIDLESDLTSVSSSLEIDLAEVGKFTQAIVGGDDIASALIRLANYQLFPTEEILSQERTRIEDDGGLETLFRQVRIGAHSSLESGTTDDGIVEWKLRERVVRGLQHCSFAYITPSIDNLIQAYGTSKIEAFVTELGFEHPITLKRTSEIFEAIEVGLYDVTACAIPTVIEQVLREKLASSGFLVINQPRGQGKGGVKTSIEDYLQKIGEIDPPILDSATIWTLQTLLVSADGGLNLRNTTLHATAAKEVQNFDTGLLLYSLIKVLTAIS